VACIRTYSDLASGDVPSPAFIAPSQCNDQHGRGNGDAFCAFDFGANSSGLTYGTLVGLNPGLIQQGDVTIDRLVKSIKASPIWRDSRTAIVIVWDENDYSGISTPPNGLFPPQNQNKVVLAVAVALARVRIRASVPEPCVRPGRLRDVGSVRPIKEVQRWADRPVRVDHCLS